MSIGTQVNPRNRGPGKDKRMIFNRRNAARAQTLSRDQLKERRAELRHRMTRLNTTRIWL